LAAAYLVNKAVFAVNSARPITGKVMFERFGLARATKRVTDYLGNQRVDFSEYLWNCCLSSFGIHGFYAQSA
jgi:hypothetical protein